MASKLFPYILLSLSLLLLPQGAAAQYSPGKKPKEGAVVEYRKVKDDTLQIRKSKLGTTKRKGRKPAAKADSLKTAKSTAKKAVAKSPAKKSAVRKETKVDSVKFSKVTYRLGDRIIMRGDSGADVRNVARILVRKLYMDEDSIIYTADGGVLYDGELVRAVVRFQNLNGFYEDGIIGYELIKALRKRK